LQDYDFILRHIPGKTNTKADIFSRKEQVNTKEDNKDVQLLKDEMWTRKTTVKITMLERKVMTEESDIVKKIWRNNTREKEIIQALEKKDGLAWEEDGVAYMEGRIYVPNNKELQSSKYWTSRTIQDAGVTQEDLLVARTQRRYQEIHARMS